MRMVCADVSLFQLTKCKGEEDEIVVQEGS